MAAMTFSAQVVRGQLRYQESLDAFEGQEVRVTVVARSRPATHYEPRTGNGDSEPPDWMAMETNLCIRMPLPGEVLEDAVVVEGESIRPCIILPQELPDE